MEQDLIPPALYGAGPDPLQHFMEQDLIPPALYGAGPDPSSTLWSRT